MKPHLVEMGPLDPLFKVIKVVILGVDLVVGVVVAALLVLMALLMWVAMVV
jgi:hypothetical protein